MKFFVKENEITPLEELEYKKAAKLFLATIPPILPGIIISSSNDIAPALQILIGKKKVEKFIVVFLNNKNRVIKIKTLYSGVENQTVVYPKDIVRQALLMYANGIIVAHNHPTGDIIPSQQDKEITRLIRDACKTLDIGFLDHLIIGNGYFSFKENGLI